MKSLEIKPFSAHFDYFRSVSNSFPLWFNRNSAIFRVVLSDASDAFLEFLYAQEPLPSKREKRFDPLPVLFRSHDNSVLSCFNGHFFGILRIFLNFPLPVENFPRSAPRWRWRRNWRRRQSRPGRLDRKAKKKEWQHRKVFSSGCCQGSAPESGVNSVTHNSIKAGTSRSRENVEPHCCSIPSGTSA